MHTCRRGDITLYYTHTHTHTHVRERTPRQQQRRQASFRTGQLSERSRQCASSRRAWELGLYCAALLWALRFTGRLLPTKSTGLITSGTIDYSTIHDYNPLAAFDHGELVSVLPPPPPLPDLEMTGADCECDLWQQWLSEVGSSHTTRAGRLLGGFDTHNNRAAGYEPGTHWSVCCHKNQQAMPGKGFAMECVCLSIICMSPVSHKCMDRGHARFISLTSWTTLLAVLN